MGAWKKSTPRREGKPGGELNKKGDFTRTGRDEDRWEGSYSVSEGAEFYPGIARSLESAGGAEEEEGEAGGASKTI